MKRTHVTGLNFEFHIDLDSELHMQKSMQSILDQGLLYEPESSFVAERLMPGDVFMDVGANIGWYSLIASQVRWATPLNTDCIPPPPVEVHAFEPEDRAFAHLLHHIELNKIMNIRPYHMALGNNVGIQRLNFCADNDGGHGFWNVENHPSHVKSKLEKRSQLCWVNNPVQMIPLSVIVGGRKLWVKVDVEGGEATVVEPILKALDKSPELQKNPPIFILEINDFCLKQMGSSEEILRGMLYERGYNSYVHNQHKLIQVMNDQYVANEGLVYNMIFSKEILA